MGEWPEDTRAALCEKYAPRDPFAELARGEISINLFRILVQQLYAWTQQDELAAAQIDQLQWQRWDFACVNRAENAPEPKHPETVERPWEAAERARARAAELAAVQQARSWFTRNVLPQTQVVRR